MGYMDYARFSPREMSLVNDSFKQEQPPIGLKPRCLFEEGRVKDICEAIIRYKQSKKSVPIEWIEELKDLTVLKSIVIYSQNQFGKLTKYAYI